MSTRFVGLLAEFEAADELLSAAEQAHQVGYRQMDAFTPFPLEGIAQWIPASHAKLTMAILAGGLLGATGGFVMQAYGLALSYPLDVAGRPHLNWPAFLPITFELGVLTAALVAFGGMFLLNGLPRPYHPIFQVPAFARASQDRFFLLIYRHDPCFHRQRTQDWLQKQGARSVWEMPQ